MYVLNAKKRVIENYLNPKTMSKQSLRGTKPQTSDIVQFAKDCRQTYYDRCIKRIEKQIQPSIFNSTIEKYYHVAYKECIEILKEELTKQK